MKAVADGPPGQWLASQLIVAFGCSLDVHLSGINVARPSDPVREVVSTATRVRLDGSAASTADGIAPESTLSVCSNAFLEGDAGQEYRRRQLAKYFYGMREAYATTEKFACAPDVGTSGKRGICSCRLRTDATWPPFRRLRFSYQLSKLLFMVQSCITHSRISSWGPPAPSSGECFTGSC